MAAPIDALAFRLARLVEVGRLPSSELSLPMRERVRSLFEASVLVEQRAGAGSSIVVKNRDGLLAFISREYPSGMAPAVPFGTPPRATSVFLKRDAKRASATNASPIVMRANVPAQLVRGEDVLDVCALTRLAGAAALVVTPGCTWQFTGVVALVENLEVFLYVERIVGDVGLVIYAHGRLSLIVRKWLASPAMAGARYVHLGDYDPVGLDEYLLLKRACPGRVELRVPVDLDERLRRYGKEELLEDSEAVLRRLRRAPDPEVVTIVNALDRHGRGLEQEALLLPA